MRIAVLGNSPNWYFDDLCRAAGPRHQLQFVAWNQLGAHVGETEMILGPPAGCDVVLVRGMPTGSLEQVVFRMDLLARWQATGTVVVNGPKSLEAAIDKYLSLTLLRQAGLPVPETRVAQTVAAAMEDFTALGGDVVVKPVFGGEGRGLIRVSDTELAWRTFRTIANLQGIIYQQRYLRHENGDTRLLVIGDQVIGMRRQNASDWRTNASRGAVCQALQPDPSQTEIAVRAARSVGAEIAGVDVVDCADGGRWVLEVNGIPGWQAIARENRLDVSGKVIEYLQGRPGC